MRIFKYIKHISYILLLVYPFPIFATDIAPEYAGQWVSVLPPVIAITFALILKRVIPALFFGVWLGAWLIRDFTLPGLFTGLLDSFQVYILQAFANPDHAAVMLFSMMIGGTVGIVSRNGGMQGIVEYIVRWADSARRAMLSTAGMGMAIFFDDYANTLVVGNTMRPVTDSMRISRAKLAYIVDSTAAPVACIALVTTWIGYEVGLIGDAIDRIPGLDMEAYLVFLSTIPYSFYPVLAILFVFLVAWSGRDFGPMLKAEQRAQEGGTDPDEHLSGVDDVASEKIEPVAGKPRRAINAILPIAVLIGSVMAGLYVTGSQSADTPPDVGLTAVDADSRITDDGAGHHGSRSRGQCLVHGLPLNALCDDYPAAGLGPGRSDGDVADRRIPGDGPGGYLARGHAADTGVRTGGRDCLCHRFKLGRNGYSHTTGHSADLGCHAIPGCGGPAAHAHSLFRHRKRAGRRSLGRSLLTHFGYHDPVFNGLRLRSYRACAHTDAVCADGWPDSHPDRQCPGCHGHAMVGRHVDRCNGAGGHSADFRCREPACPCQLNNRVDKAYPPARDHELNPAPIHANCMTL
jgi:hypothetical protein